MAFLQLPVELRLRIYEELCPCLSDKEDYCNPILSRRLGDPKSFVCYKCAGRVFLQVCTSTRLEVSPMVFAAHEFRFQLWAEHKPALEAWFQIIDERSAGHIRRFRLHTQYPGESLNEGRTPGIATAMPGYIAVDLDAESTSQMVVSSRTWTHLLLEEPRKRIQEIVNGLSRVEGRFELDKRSLLEIVDLVGWFGTRNARERAILEQQSPSTRRAANWT